MHVACDLMIKLVKNQDCESNSVLVEDLRYSMLQLYHLILFTGKHDVHNTYGNNPYSNNTTSPSCAEFSSTFPHDINGMPAVSTDHSCDNKHVSSACHGSEQLQFTEGKATATAQSRHDKGQSGTKTERSKSRELRETKRQSSCTKIPLDEGSIPCADPRSLLSCKLSSDVDLCLLSWKKELISSDSNNRVKESPTNSNSESNIRVKETSDNNHSESDIKVKETPTNSHSESNIRVKETPAISHSESNNRVMDTLTDGHSDSNNQVKETPTNSHSDSNNRVMDTPNSNTCSNNNKVTELEVVGIDTAALTCQDMELRSNNQLIDLNRETAATLIDEQREEICADVLHEMVENVSTYTGDISAEISHVMNELLENVERAVVDNPVHRDNKNVTHSLTGGSGVSPALFNNKYKIPKKKCSETDVKQTDITADNQDKSKDINLYATKTLRARKMSGHKHIETSHSQESQHKGEERSMGQRKDWSRHQSDSWSRNRSEERISESNEHMYQQGGTT